MAHAAALSLRVEPELKAAAEKAAADGQRAVANFVENIPAESLRA